MEQENETKELKRFFVEGSITLEESGFYSAEDEEAAKTMFLEEYSEYDFQDYDIEVTEEKRNIYDVYFQDTKGTARHFEYLKEKV